MNRLKRVLVIACTLLLLGGFSQTFTTLSYLQGNYERVNNFKVGYNDSEIIETFVKPPNLNKGTVVNKKVQVKNTGNVPCYVRVLVLPTSNPGSFRLETKGSVDDSLSSSKAWYHTGGWDNYYYYKRVLQPGETTSALFDGVTLLEDLNSLKVEDAQIIVYEESNQSEGYSDCIKAFE